MFEWLRSMLPHLPHYGAALVFIVVFLNNLGFPLPGETILLGAGFVLGKVGVSLWQPMLAASVACFLGSICAFWAGRRLGDRGQQGVRWLHLTPQRMQWPERFFKRHGAKTVLIVRFIPLFPPVVPNLLAGMSRMRWPAFLFFNLVGSALYPVAYMLIGYLFGRKWGLFEAWLGNSKGYVIAAILVLITLVAIFRKPLMKLWSRLVKKEA
jgi:membrane-associated protein